MAKGQREVEERNDTGKKQHSIKIISLRVKGRPDTFPFLILQKK